MSARRAAAASWSTSRAHFPGPQRLRPAHRLAARASTACRSPCGRARRSASWARAAAASPRSARRSMGIHAPTAGEILFEGREIGRLPRARAARGAPATCSTLPGPRRLARSALEDPAARCTSRCVIHTQLTPGRARARRCARSCAAVGLPDAHLDLYPHELSGGQQRRVGLARILTLRPRLVDPRRADLRASTCRCRRRVLKLFREPAARRSRSPTCSSRTISSVVRADVRSASP